MSKWLIEVMALHHGTPTSEIATATWS